MTPSVLKFIAGRFLLTDYDETTRRSLSKNEYWSRRACPDYVWYETISLRAAAAFRSVSDPVAEKIFKRAFQTHYTVPPLPPLPLDPHQKVGLEWILKRKRSYLAHAPGAGKTAQAILAACLATGPGQNLFIVPPSLTLNWEREIWKFTDWLGTWPTIGVVPRSDKQERMAWRSEFIICPDSMLTKPWVYQELVTMRKKLVAVDEASRFKDPFSERSIAFYGGQTAKQIYPGLFQDARHVVLMDGSPMPNRPMELWAPTYALHPETIDCMDQDDFGYRYCGPRIDDRGRYTFNHSSHERELQTRLQRDFMHVVTEKELTHPERRRSMVFMSEDVRSGEQKTWEQKHLDGLLKLGIDEESSQGELARFRRELGVRKIPWIASYTAERLKEKNESILLFAWHREVVDGLAAKLSSFHPGVVMGGTSDRDRERYFSAFQTGKTKILILNIAAGGRGHNLQRADRVLFGEFSWGDEMNKQCEKRASRRGSEKAFVRCEYIVSPASMDERVLTSVFTKQKRVERIIG